MGDVEQGEAKPQEGEQRKASWLARWRQRRRDNSARAADIGRRLWEADRRNVDNASKYGGGGGG